MSIQTLTRGTSTPRTVSTPRAAASGAARPPPEPTSVPVGAGEYHAPMAELQQLSLSPSAPPTEPADESADEPSAGDMASTVETAGPTPPSKDHDMVLPEPGTGPKMQATHMQPTGAPAEARAAIDEAPAQGPAAPQELAAAPSERVEQPVAETEAPARPTHLATQRLRRPRRARLPQHASRRPSRRCPPRRHRLFHPQAPRVRGPSSPRQCACRPYRCRCLARLRLIHLRPSHRYRMVCGRGATRACGPQSCLCATSCTGSGAAPGPARGSWT